MRLYLMHPYQRDLMLSRAILGSRAGHPPATSALPPVPRRLAAGSVLGTSNSPSVSAHRSRCPSQQTILQIRCLCCEVNGKVGGVCEGFWEWKYTSIKYKFRNN